LNRTTHEGSNKPSATEFDLAPRLLCRPECALGAKTHPKTCVQGHNCPANARIRASGGLLNRPKQEGSNKPSVTEFDLAPRLFCRPECALGTKTHVFGCGQGHNCPASAWFWASSGLLDRS